MNTNETNLKDDINHMITTVVTRHPDLTMHVGMAVDHICNGLTYEELAEKYQMTINTVRHKINAALRRFRHPVHSEPLRIYC